MERDKTIYISPKEKELQKKDDDNFKSKYSLGSMELYRENIYFIRQYPNLLKITDRLIRENIKDIENDKGFLEMRKRVELIERAFCTIPFCYREGVLEHIVNKIVYSNPKFDNANIKTWKYWTQKVVYEVAIRRGQKELIEAIKKRV